MHNNKLNVWAANNLAPLDVLILSIVDQYNKPNKSKNHTKAFCLLLAFCKNRILFLSAEKLVRPKLEQPGRFHWPSSILALHNMIFCHFMIYKMSTTG